MEAGCSLTFGSVKPAFSNVWVTAVPPGAEVSEGHRQERAWLSSSPDPPEPAVGFWARTPILRISASSSLKVINIHLKDWSSGGTKMHADAFYQVNRIQVWYGIIIQ